MTRLLQNAPADSDQLYPGNTQRAPTLHFIVISEKNCYRPCVCHKILIPFALELFHHAPYPIVGQTLFFLTFLGDMATIEVARSLLDTQRPEFSSIRQINIVLQTRDRHMEIFSEITAKGRPSPS